MSRKNADWIDKRLRQTTVLGESSALVVNDIVANQPPVSRRPLIIVILVSGGWLTGIYADIPDNVRVIILEDGTADRDPTQSAQSLDVEPLSALDKAHKLTLFHAGIRFPNGD